jgi:hypothetical protein
MLRPARIAHWIVTGAIVVAAFAATERPARAQGAPPPAERSHEYSPYERETIEQVLGGLHLVRDPSPDGKLVERVDIVRLDVFEPRDLESLLRPFEQAINGVFGTSVSGTAAFVARSINTVEFKTREHVIRDEVLLREGMPYSDALVDDTIRNLRRAPGVPQLSLVLVVPAIGSAPDRTVLVVITKDVENWRLNWDLVGTQGGIDFLAFEPAQTNFLGLHHIPSVHFFLEPLTYTFGASYLVPRIEHSRIAVFPSVDVMLNKQGNVEGTYGSLVAGEPLYSGSTPWAWDTSVAWHDQIYRLYSNAQLASYRDTSTGRSVPFQYRYRTFTATYEATRSFGWDVNHDFTAGVNLTRGVYQSQFPGVDARTAADFVANYVPLSDTEVGPFLQYHTYTMRFLRVVDFDTLALQEDYRLGHDVLLRAYPSARVLGSTRDVLLLRGAAQYTWPIRDGLARVSVEAVFDPQVDRVSDAAFQPTAHLVTPSIGKVGRIVMDTTLIWRWRNYLNQHSVLGGADRLRGFPTNFFVGQDLVAYNLEFRTRPVEIATSELAGVAFYDVGDAFKGFGSAYQGLDHFVPYQSVGFGVRALIPWLDRTVFQADVGFPVERPVDPTTGAPIPPWSFVISFGQAFWTPTVAPAPVLPTGQAPDAP